MSVKSDFAENEWQLLKEAPMLAGTAIMLTGKTGSSKERWTLIQATAAGQNDYPTNALIQAVLTQDEWTDAELDQFGKEYAGMPSDAIRADVAEKCRQAVAVLAAKATPSESQEYRAWVYSVAVAVAKAAKEGGFLGIGGERVSEAERDTLAELAQALGVDSETIAG